MYDIIFEKKLKFKKKFFLRHNLHNNHNNVLTSNKLMNRNYV